MNDFVRAFMEPAAAVWGIFALLLIYARQKGLSFTRQEKRSFIGILIVLAAVSGWFFFFKDASFIFSCQKSTQRCDYFHSTLYNKNLRLSRSYDLTGIKEIEIVPHKRSCGRHCTKTVYRIRFQGNGDGFEMPKDFDFKDDVRKQAAKASAFVQTDKSAYLYKDIMPDGAGKTLMFVIAALMSTAFAFVGIFTILTKRFVRK